MRFVKSSSSTAISSLDQLSVDTCELSDVVLMLISHLAVDYTRFGVEFDYFNRAVIPMSVLRLPQKTVEGGRSIYFYSGLSGVRRQASGIALFFVKMGKSRT